MTSSFEQKAITGTRPSPETHAAEKNNGENVEVDDVLDSTHIDAQNILREVEERQKKKRDACVIFFRAMLGTNVEDYAELCKSVTRQMSRELESMRPDTLNEDQFAAFLSLLLDSFDPAETSLQAFLALNIRAFTEERAKPRQTEGDIFADTQKWLARDTAPEGEENVDIGPTLRRAFDDCCARGFTRPSDDQIGLSKWLAKENHIGIPAYADAVWILAQEFLDYAIERINEYCSTYPQINSSEFLYRGLYAIFRSIDLYIPNSVKTMEDFVQTGIDIALERTAGN